jgi:hypothetical protein
MAYRRTTVSSFLRAVFAIYMPGLTLLHGSVFTVFTLQLLPPYGRTYQVAPCQVANWTRFITILLLLSRRAKIPTLVDVPMSLALTLCAVSSFVLEGAKPSTMPWYSFSESWSYKQIYTDSSAPSLKQIYFTGWQIIPRDPFKRTY